MKRLDSVKQELSKREPRGVSTARMLTLQGITKLF